MLRNSAPRRPTGWTLRDVTQRSSAPRTFSDIDPLLLLGRRHRWVLTHAELRSAGFSRSKITRLRTAGWLDNRFHGVYLVGRHRPSRDELERAALKACGDGAVLSHRSAAVRWRIMRSYRGPVEVTTPRRCGKRGPLRARTGRLDPRDITIKDGVPITTLARTLVDLAAVLDEEALATAVHEAEFCKLLRVPAVDAAMTRAGRRPGRPALRRCLRDHRPTTGRVDRELERRFVRFLHRHGFPPTRHNVTFRLEDGEEVTLDVYFEHARFGIELDGRQAHDTTRNFHRDRRKDRRLDALHRVLVRRVTRRDLDVHEQELAADLWATLTRRS